MSLDLLNTEKILMKLPSGWFDHILRVAFNSRLHILEGRIDERSYDPQLSQQIDCLHYLLEHWE